ncbi:FAD/NAD(P)-binding protein [Oculatella sp. LEGE 06141]|uniref:FAD/NAD(P)-binding protein n=1 Tax=Oculatella sp. LEGE 06141 TaxID=1828648 RepID=UPI0018810224|nr:FAD/NAD(P)-binding protein [Oculatella sp. LEGE 06141]MBE9178039.1 FAD/NAD(P)-binding protein [Oculatella sp. LEGE 06141]
MASSAIPTRQHGAIASPKPRAIAILGGGLSGALVAIHLLKTARHPLSITLIDRHHLGQGTAYSTSFDCHLLNVPAGKMSLFADQPDHFLHWLQSQGKWNQPTLAQSFIPRKIYGQYIQATLDQAEIYASSQVQLHRISDEAIALQPVPGGMTIHLRYGSPIRADRVVLALGNLPPVPPPVADPTFYSSDRYIDSAWTFQPNAVASDAPVILMGSSLTAIDTVLALRQQKHQGTIHLVSRHGLLPHAHKQIDATVPPLSVGWDSSVLSHVASTKQPITVRHVMRQVRQAVESAVAQGHDWRSVIDAIRPHTQRLWQSLSVTEQRRFLRHVRVYWDNHRHRIAPGVADAIAHLQQINQLKVHAGRILAYDEDRDGVNVVMRQRCCHEQTTLRGSVVINCTGATGDYRKASQQLIASLLDAKLICPDELSLGLRVASNGAIVDAVGTVSQHLYTLGSPRKGELWETTAVREIRDQAKVLTQELLSSVQPPASHSSHGLETRSIAFSQ